jgi:hypothetical protein
MRIRTAMGAIAMVVSLTAVGVVISAAPALAQNPGCTGSATAMPSPSALLLRRRARRAR